MTTLPTEPPPAKTNTGLIIRLVVGGGAPVMVCGLVLSVGLFAHAVTAARHRQAGIAASLSPGAGSTAGSTDDGSSADDHGDSPTPSPSPTGRDPSALD